MKFEVIFYSETEEELLKKEFKADSRYAAKKVVNKMANDIDDASGYILKKVDDVSKNA